MPDNLDVFRIWAKQLAWLNLEYWQKVRTADMFCCFSLHAVSVCVGGVGSGAAGDKNLISAVVIEIEEANLLGECEVMT